MEKTILLSFACVLFVFSTIAQQKEQKIVFDFTKADTADFRIMVLQLNNVLKEAPTTKMEVVCSLGGLNLLVTDKTNMAKEIADLQKVANNVVFAACANTMRKLKIEKSQLIPEVTIVPVAQLELAAKQQQGWSYIKAGR